MTHEQSLDARRVAAAVAASPSLGQLRSELECKIRNATLNLEAMSIALTGYIGPLYISKSYRNDDESETIVTDKGFCWDNGSYVDAGIETPLYGNVVSGYVVEVANA